MREDLGVLSCAWYLAIEETSNHVRPNMKPYQYCLFGDLNQAYLLMKFGKLSGFISDVLYGSPGYPPSCSNSARPGKGDLGLMLEPYLAVGLPK